VNRVAGIWVALVAACSPSDEVRCAERGPASMMVCVDAARYDADLRFVTGERPPKSEHWQAVQDHCARVLTDSGYAVELQRYGTGVNVIGRKPGTTLAGERVVLGAHYDHLVGCPGADDNASGVAAVLEIARALAAVEFPRTLVVACWDQEEVGLIGSKAFATGARDAGEQITVAYCLDMIAFKSDQPNSQAFPENANLLFFDEYKWLEANQFRADFIGLAADTASHPHTAAFARYAGQIGLPTLTLELNDLLKNHEALEPLRRTDHASFWAVDTPAIAVSDSAELRNPNYHCRNGRDTLDTLDLGFAHQVVRTTAAAVAASLGMPGD